MEEQTGVNNSNEIVPVETIVIDERKLLSLENEASLEEKQRILNEIFTQERREKLVNQASVDIKGRRVRYYREMGWDYLQILLRKGSLTAYEYFQNAQEGFDDHYTALDSQVDRKDLLSLLENYSWFLQKDMDIPLDIENEEEIQKIIASLIPDAESEEIKKIMEEPTYKNLLPFLEKHLPLDFQRRLHTGSARMHFSTLLSFSVGGPVMDRIYRGRVIVEVIAPDKIVINHPERVEGEKEVFMKEIKRDEIARAWVSDEQLSEEVLTNPDIPVGDFYKRIIPERKSFSIAPHDAWRWDEPTKDCLPVGLARTDKLRNN